MTEQNTPTPEVKPGEQATGAVKPETIPYDRFKEVNDRLKAAEAKAAEMEAAQEKARKAQLEKQGEYKTLLDEANKTIESLTGERDAFKGKWDTYEAGRRQALIEKLPEDKRESCKGLDLSALETVVSFIPQGAATVTTPTEKPGARAKAFQSIKEAAEAFGRGEINAEKYKEITKSLRP